MNLNCSARTIKCTLNEAGYYKCKACQKHWLNTDNAVKRVEFAEETIQWPDWKWKQVHQTDETHFYMNFKATEFIIRTDKERNYSDCIQKKRKVETS